MALEGHISLSDPSFFSYSSKKGYLFNSTHKTSSFALISFNQNLELLGISNQHIIVRLWRSSRLRKIATLIWFNFNGGLPLVLSSFAWASTPFMKFGMIQSLNPPNIVFLHMCHGDHYVGCLPQSLEQMGGS